MINSRVRHFAATTLILLISICTACTTMQPVTMDAIHSQIHTGDTVQVFTQDSRSETLQVAAVDDTGLVGIADGARVEIPYQTIQRLGVRRVSSARTASVIIGVVAAIVLGAAVAHADQHNIGP